MALTDLTVPGVLAKALFRLVGKNWLTTKSCAPWAQLFVVNRSSIPSLLFEGGVKDCGGLAGGSKSLRSSHDHHPQGQAVVKGNYFPDQPGVCLAMGILFKGLVGAVLP